LKSERRPDAGGAGRQASAGRQGPTGNQEPSGARRVVVARKPEDVPRGQSSRSGAPAGRDDDGTTYNPFAALLKDRK